MQRPRFTAAATHPRAISSEVEHYLDTVGVTGSIPVSPISLLIHTGLSESQRAIPVPPSAELPPGSAIAVIGLGRTGLGVARLFRAEGHPVLLLESREGPEHQAAAASLQAEGIAVRLGAPLALESLPEPRPAAVLVSPEIGRAHV